MTKSCRCWWADDDGTCSLGEDPPAQETCAFQADRIDMMTGKPMPALDLEYPKGWEPEKTWRNKA
jgi:hypothetical protein